MSEEFLRKYESGEAFGSTLGEVVPVGDNLFSEPQDKPKSQRGPRRQEQEADPLPAG